jgi:hypothetical protein
MCSSTVMTAAGLPPNLLLLELAPSSKEEKEEEGLHGVFKRHRHHSVILLAGVLLLLVYSRPRCVIWNCKSNVDVLTGVSMSGDCAVKHATADPMKQCCAACDMSCSSSNCTLLTLGHSLTAAAAAAAAVTAQRFPLQVLPWAVTADVAVVNTAVDFDLRFPKTGGGEDIDYCLKVTGSRLLPVPQVIT